MVLSISGGPQRCTTIITNYLFILKHLCLTVEFKLVIFNLTYFLFDCG